LAAPPRPPRPRLAAETVHRHLHVLGCAAGRVAAVSAAVYVASETRRRRRTKAEMEAFRATLYDLAGANRPCSVRQVCYLGIGKHWEKDQGSSRRVYSSIVRELGILRERDALPWDWITDHTRLRRIDAMFDSIQDAAARFAEAYRRDLWSQQPRVVEVWCESDSIGGVLDAVTRPLGVPLLAARGQSSKTFAFAAAQEYRRIGKPVTILYVGDWDPSGLAIDRSLQERLGRYCEGEVEIDFTRLAVTPFQIKHYGLTSHEANRQDKNYRQFVAACQQHGLPVEAVEVEAIPPAELRGLLEGTIYRLVADPEA
jgi:hypothetical protein